MSTEQTATLVSALVVAVIAAVPGLLAYRAQWRKAAPEGIGSWQELVTELRNENRKLFEALQEERLARVEAQAEFRGKLAAQEAVIHTQQGKIAEQAAEIQALKAKVAEQERVISRLVSGDKKDR